jgi:hypothetical protein
MIHESKVSCRKSKTTLAVCGRTVVQSLREFGDKTDNCLVVLGDKERLSANK